MANQVVERSIGRTPNVTVTRVGGLHLVMLALVALAAVGVALVAASNVSNDTPEAAISVQAETARWEALVASEYPGATARARAEADRWTALAAAYEGHSVLTSGRIAEATRWEALASRYTRVQTAEAARWNGLADHYLAHPAGVQAWADRYQGLADSSG